MGAANDVQAHLKALVGLKPEQVARREALGQQYHFEGVLPTFARFKALCQRLRDLDLGSVPEKLIVPLARAFGGFVGVLQSVMSFDPHPRGSAGRDQLSQQLEGSYGEVAEAAVPVLSWHMAFGQEQAVEIARRAGEEAQRLLAEVQQAKADGDAALSALKTASGKAAVRREAGYFEARANGHARVSLAWLCVTAAALVVLALFAAWWLWKPYPDRVAQVPQSDRTFAMVAFLTAKVLALAVLGYALSWAARNYRAHRHNEIVNRHRAIALQTFEAFEKGIEGDPQARNAILLQAAQCAFSPQITGYMTGEPDPLPHNTIVELVKSVGVPQQKP
jgi:hypothetical protein